MFIPKLHVLFKISLLVIFGAVYICLISIRCLIICIRMDALIGSSIDCTDFVQRALDTHVSKKKMGAPKQKWTAEEEAALKAGVLKHGAGKWRTILTDPEFSGILHLRSNVDLKVSILYFQLELSTLTEESVITHSALKI